MIKALGFVTGFILMAILELILLSSFNRLPAGLGWFVMPFMVGMVCARLAPSVQERLAQAPSRLQRLAASEFGHWRNSQSLRFVVVAAIFWLIATPVCWWLFEPYEYRMYRSDYLLLLKIMIFPVVMLIAGYVAYIKFVRIDSSSNEAG